eukprot:CAMPEP_0181223048 /NCGR_PEP_ID=MMETSP1096-20121128/30300_1 /TAXON_ID=156174 ORGANISM="Chrysochromulina ericina, Strain CCMP281" /NCGR_SAMPLE_ID=MMETSP1096 /ASSEMBLY_ACC=CAM_ASM_000453 /LENGTH=47 /DNA_ID= /DNA_START= /DNA_END= /DNA_ORIENTATION=
MYMYCRGVYATTSTDRDTLIGHPGSMHRIFAQAEGEGLRCQTGCGLT